jgi:hypothetical protein
MKPGDFLLGVLDFFAVLLPGSMFTWLATQYLPPDALRRALSPGWGGEPDSVVVITALLLSSYLFGHLVFMAGAKLDPMYDGWRRRTKQMDADKGYNAAKELQAELTKKLVGGEFSTLKWAKTYVQVIAPGARVEIDRLEANSKFFRSLVVVSVAFTAHFLLREQTPAMGVATIVIGILSYQRYVEERWKMTELSYATAVIAHAAKTMKLAAAPADE